MAATAPDRFPAYVGMAQIAYQLRSEVMAHAALLTACRQRGDTAMVRGLAAAPISLETGLSLTWMRLRDRAMHGLGAGNTHAGGSVITGIFLPVWRVRSYSVLDKINVWRSKLRSRPFFWEAMLRDDLRLRLTKFDLPVHFLAGRHDLTVNPTLMRDYFDRINAPEKGFHLFENSCWGRWRRSGPWPTMRCRSAAMSA